jgi:hypothetical protein
MLEVSPLYIRQAHTTVEAYSPLYPWATGPRNLTVGGYVEPFAFGGPPPAAPLAANTTTALLELPAVPVPFSLANASAASRCLRVFVCVWLCARACVCAASRCLRVRVCLCMCAYLGRVCL